jgi:hypothetical protein
VVADNKAGMDGGGIAVLGLSVCQTADSQIVGNEAGLDGGGVYIDGPAVGVKRLASLVGTHTYFGANTAIAGVGGGVSGLTNGNVTLYDCRMSSNTAGSDGGALGFESGIGMDLRGLVLIGNKAGSDGAGGAIFIRSSVASGFECRGCVFESNLAGAYGDRMASGRYTLQMHSFLFSFLIFGL